MFVFDQQIVMLIFMVPKVFLLLYDAFIKLMTVK